MSHDEITILQRQIRDIQEILRKESEDNSTFKKIVTEYIEADAEYKEKTKPMYEMFENGSGFAKTIMVLFKVLGAIGVAWGGYVVVKAWAYSVLIK